jgi:hypothetical protein
MAATKFTAEVEAALIDLIGDGLSLADAARQVEVSQKTVRNYLSRGRNDPDGKYGAFAAAVDGAKADAAEKEEPIDREELMLLLSRAARKGSVQAMKLLDEIHVREARAADGESEPADPFDALDGPVDLAAVRDARAAGQ